MAYQFLLVALGGAAGSVSRFLLSGWVQRLGSTRFPWGTFAVNLFGCLLFGLLAGLAEDREFLGKHKVLLMVGFLGGFTTFSSYTWDTFLLIRDARMGAALANISGQVVLGLAALWIGWGLSRLAP